MKHRITALMVILFFAAHAVAGNANPPIDIGSRRELFVDHHLIDRLDGTRLVLHRPQPRETR